jgi:hypothetical protein
LVKFVAIDVKRGRGFAKTSNEKMGISGFPKTEFGKLDIRRLDYEN